MLHETLVTDRAWRQVRRLGQEESPRELNLLGLFGAGHEGEVTIVSCRAPGKSGLRALRVGPPGRIDQRESDHVGRMFMETRRCP